MKKTLLSFIALSMVTMGFAQVQNGGFEVWSELSLFSQPDMGIDVASSNYETFFETGQVNVNAVPNGDGFALRMENIGQGDNVMPGYFLTGMTPDSEGEMLVFGGGISASDPAVTGISVDLRYDIPVESPGFIIVQFKLEGEPTGTGNMGPGTFYFPISGEKSWGMETFDFEAPFNTTYDQVVIGIACSDLINEDAPFPSEAWLEADNLDFVNSTDEVPNGDFDTWAMVPPINIPVGVEVDLNPFETQFFRSEDAFEGNFAMGLQSVERDGFVDAGFALMGEMVDDEIVPTISITDEHTMISFQYKYTAVSDMGEAMFIFFEEQGDEMVPAYFKTIDLEPTDEYTVVEYPFVEDLEENFIDASMVAIEFRSGKMDENPEAGSTLLIDDVEVSGTLSTFGVARDVIPQLSAFPNPTLARVIFDFGTTRTGFYRVYNNQGFQIDMVEFQSEEEIIHNLYGMPSGKYVFRFYHNGGVETARVMKL